MLNEKIIILEMYPVELSNLNILSPRESFASITDKSINDDREEKRYEYFGNVSTDNKEENFFYLSSMDVRINN